MDRAHSPVFAAPEAYARLIGGPDLLLVIGAPGRPVAFAAFSTVLDEASLLNIVVAPGERRCGSASRLLEAARESLAEAGARHVYLEVRASNDAATRLYCRAGFEVYGRRKAYYASTGEGPAEDALLLRWDLPVAGRDVA
jgi:ribosomal-protein-alanine N-acetyltransferase